MMSYAHSFNSRVVAINRRDYLGSKGYTKEELDLLCRDGPGDAAIQGFNQFTKDRGEEFLVFLSWFVHENNVPPKRSPGFNSQQHPLGGLAIMSWSAGASLMLSILANLAAFPKSLMTELTECIRDIIVFGE